MRTRLRSAVGQHTAQAELRLKARDLLNISSNIDIIRINPRYRAVLLLVLLFVIII